MRHEGQVCAWALAKHYAAIKHRLSILMFGSECACTSRNVTTVVLCCADFKAVQFDLPRKKNSGSGGRMSSGESRSRFSIYRLISGSIS